ncbi:galactose mutarotase-like protein [Penicillium chermesinum]|nr:galactose mutarotase-like protein [Penicillium chermesinum]
MLLRTPRLPMRWRLPGKQTESIRRVDPAVPINFVFSAAHDKLPVLDYVRGAYVLVWNPWIEGGQGHG